MPFFTEYQRLRFIPLSHGKTWDEHEWTYGQGCEYRPAA
jgi:hypothetical protein